MYSASIALIVIECHLMFRRLVIHKRRQGVVVEVNGLVGSKSLEKAASRSELHQTSLNPATCDNYMYLYTTRHPLTRRRTD